ncbi:MAG: phosphate/phosphite/phosphonate ABC transporter substrate-binding protein, partial [Pseudomonadota bacterium]
MSPKSSFLIVAAVSTYAPAPAALADFVLNERYVDADGDLVADTPANPAEQIDPNKLIFAYSPGEDPETHRVVWAEFLEHLSQVTGKDVEYFSVQSNAAQIETMRAGRLHVASFGTGTVPIAVACAGFQPFAMMAAADGSYGYEMEIITFPGSPIDAADDIRGRTLTHTSPTSNSGFKAPTALMKAEFGLISGEDYETNFSGRHDNSILGVINRDYEVATISSGVKERMVARGVISPDQFEVLFTSQTFPSIAYGTAHNLAPELQSAVQDAFFSFDWEGTALQE